MRIINPRLVKGFKGLGKSKGLEIFGAAELIRNASPKFKPRFKYGISHQVIKKKPFKLQIVRKVLEENEIVKPQIKPNLIKVAPQRETKKALIKTEFEPRVRPLKISPHLLELIEKEAR